jgi:CheY-like chemotaxis protein
MGKASARFLVVDDKIRNLKLLEALLKPEGSVREQSVDDIKLKTITAAHRKTITAANRISRVAPIEIVDDR